MLQRYAADPRVLSIAGNNFQVDDPPDGASYYFSRFRRVWGWATWRRAWAFHDPAMRAWPAARAAHWLDTLFEASGTRAGIGTTSFRRPTTVPTLGTTPGLSPAGSRAGCICTRPPIWSATWALAGRPRTPRPPTTCSANLPIEPMPFPLRHPPAVARAVAADDYTERTLFGGTLHARVQPGARPPAPSRRGPMTPGRVQVLHLLPQFGPGGATQCVLQSARLSAAAGPYSHHLISLAPLPPAAPRLIETETLRLTVAPTPAALHELLAAADLVQVNFWNTPELYAVLRAPWPAARVLLWSQVAGRPAGGGSAPAHPRRGRAGRSCARPGRPAGRAAARPGAQGRRATRHPGVGGRRPGAGGSADGDATDRRRPGRPAVRGLVGGPAAGLDGPLTARGGPWRQRTVKVLWSWARTLPSSALRS